MENILLFGSGDGAKKYLLKNQNLNVLAIFDNDKQKQGKSLENIKIYAPDKIKNFKFDKIVIVSQWAKEIYEQLTIELNVDPSKVKIPAKKDIKSAHLPFEDRKTIELAREIVKYLSKSAIKKNIPLFLDFGTLLGIVRDEDIIKWDDDVDFSITEDALSIDFSKWITKTVKQFKSSVDFSIKSKSIDNRDVSYVLNFENINNNYQYREFSISISLRELKDDFYMHLPSGGMWYAPREHFDRYEILNWQNQDLYVPYRYEDYLTFLYGNWKIPKKNITMADYANLSKVEYRDFMNLGIGYKEIK